MKALILLLALTISSQSFAGATARAVRSAIQSSSRAYRPIISELDVMKTLRTAQGKARAEQVSERMALFPVIEVAGGFMNKPATFHASVASQSEFAKTSKKRIELVLEGRMLDSRTKKRILELVKNSDWRSIGHFEASVKQLENTDDSFLLKIEIVGVNTTDLNNIRGISKIVNDSFRAALENRGSNVIVSTMRPSTNAPVGAR